MPPPRNLKKGKHFLGLAAYFRNFLSRFADILQPLTALTKRDVPYEWTHKRQDSFDLLKKYLIESPILKYPDPDEPYTLFTDTNKYAFACVLTQVYDHIIAEKEMTILHSIIYLSGLFQGSQLNWATITKEAYTIYMSIKKLSFYLDGADISLKINHLNLKRFLEKNSLNSWCIIGQQRLNNMKLNLNTLKELIP